MSQEGGYLQSSASCQGKILRRKEIVYDEDKDVLGSGGFGVVYRCRLANSSEVVAVKRLITPYRLKDSDAAAFIREASILQRLMDCPYIIRFLGMCIEPGHYAIVMEYVEYGNLEDMLLSGVDDHPIIKQWDCRIRMALEIAKGMNYLHSLPSPIIHRDLKTTNVLVGRNYGCKIIDFGLAKLREISSKQSTTGYKGTVAFTAPEMFDGKLEREKEIKVDVYSYAIILWQLKEMKPIYDSTLPPSVLRVNVIGGHRPRLSDNGCIEGYKEIMERCWDGQPDCRLHFKEILVMLNGIRSQLSFGNSTTTPIGQSPRLQVGRDDEQLVQQLRQQIEQLTQDGSAKDKIIEQLRETPRQHVQVGKGDEQLLVQELIHKIEQLSKDGSAKDEENRLLRQQNSSLEELRRDDQLQRERAFSKERREKEELLRRLQQDKDNVQKNLDEAQIQIVEICEESDNLQQLLITTQREKTNVEELLCDADAVIERYREEKRTEVVYIPSHDIQLTGTRLGRGSYADVCVGYWRGCPVAVKMLHDQLAAVQIQIQFMQQEASVAWKIHHPNVVAVCGVTLELEDKKAWIVMELHSGSMSDVIYACRRDVEPLTLREKVDMTHDSLCGLDYIHSMQPTEILHGDICPRNIMVTATMRAKLGDLGAARFEDASLSVGPVSAQYTPLERIDNPNLPKRKKTDMYSTGVTICELFTALYPERENRIYQIALIRQLHVRTLCKDLMRDDPARRPTAAEARHVISGIRETAEYRTCSPRRMVKGKMDGIADVTLV